MRSLITPLAALCALACNGQISDPLATSGPGRGPGSGGSALPPGVAFELPQDKLVLLPFDVRVNKLASIVGVPSDDPMFDELWAKRYELGDHDYARGIAPDLSWTASRMAVWLRTLRPVCASDAMRARYPSMRDGLDAFVPAAFGRRATDADGAAYDAAIAGAGLSPDEEHRAMCLALLSSAELVAR